MLLLLACSAADSDSAPLATSGTLSTLSYNVHGLPEAITGDDTAARIAQIAPLLPTFDLIGLQEDFIDENHTVLDAACDHESRLRWNTPLDETRVYGAGLGLYARAPTVSSGTGYYSTCYGMLDDGSDCLASKGWVRLRIQLGAGELDFYTTHLEAGSGEGDDPARSTQVDELLAEIVSASANTAVLLVGDFNLDGGDLEDEIEIAKLDAAGLRNACMELDCPEPERIDRLLMRDAGLTLTPTSWEALPWVDDAGVPLSDHDPIAVSLDWAVAD